MKTKHLPILLLLFVPNLLSAQKYSKAEINDFIDQWHQDAANVDMEAYFDKIADDGIFIGTDETEVWTKQEFYDWSKPIFDKGKAWEFNAFERNIYYSKDKKNAWFDEKLETTIIPFRGSGVLSLSKNRIKIEHYVLSIPVPNEKFRNVAKAITEEGEDQNTKKKQED
jgi:hypothetical protein